MCRAGREPFGHTGEISFLAGLSWFDAHFWAYAEVHGITELLSEDFQHGRMYGTVTVRNPFLALSAST